MSFSAYFTAHSKAHAKELLEKQSLPVEVKAFIASAVNNLPGHDGQRFIKVSAIGHLCERSGDYGLSNAEIKVEPIVANA